MKPTTVNATIIAGIIRRPPIAWCETQPISRM